MTDFTINANGTLNLLEAARRHKPDATFVFTSTNKVYGDRPNALPLDGAGDAARAAGGASLLRRHRHLDVDRPSRLHSLFGASKVAADVLVQEYGRYFEMPTVCFRGGCLTGPNHAGARLHGFLSYLMRCTVTGEPYTVFGYDGQAGARQHPQRRPRRARSRRSTPHPRAARRLQHRRRPRLATARCSRRSSCASRSPAATLDWTLGDDAADRRPPLVDQRPRAVPCRLSRLAARVRRRARSCVRSTSGTPRPGRVAA